MPRQLAALSCRKEKSTERRTEWAGLLGWLGGAWFRFGNQGWEFLEIGRFWQILLVIGLIYWFGLLWRTVAPA
jgi:nitric oxide reductase subunit B